MKQKSADKRRDSSEGFGVRHRHTRLKKIRIVLEGLRGEENIRACRREGIASMYGGKSSRPAAPLAATRRRRPRGEGPSS